MQHYEAVETLNRILPEILKGDVSANLVKVASRNRWHPEVLRKVAHVYNMARTLSVYDSDNRGGRPAVIDPPEVVNAYLKVAAVAAEEPVAFRDTWGLPANGTVLKLAGASHEIEPTRARDFWSGTGLPQVEVSAGPTAVSPMEMKRAFHEGLACYREVRQIGYNKACESAEQLEKVALAINSFNDKSAAFNRVATDAHGVFGDTDRAAVWIEKLAARCGDLGIDTSTYDSNAWKGVVVARDHTTFAQNLKMAADAHDMVLGAERVKLDYLSKAASIAAEHGSLLGIEGHMAMRRLMHEEFPGIEQSQDKEASDRTDEWLASLDKLAAAPGERRPKSEGEKDNVVDFPGGGERPRQQPKERGFAEGFGNAVSTAVGGGKGGYGLVRGHLDAKRGENEMKAEGEEAERFRILRLTRAAGHLQRLMHTDEVLREKPFERVSSAFNTILGASPEVASDPELLRLLLRQALETQGVDIESAGAARKFEYGGYRKDIPVPR
jgi:hypothetical protein